MPPLIDPDKILDYANKSPLTEWYRNEHGVRAKTDVARVLIGCMDLPKAAGEDGAGWDTTPMGLAQINTPDSELLSIDNKCRQRGWSFNESGISVARGMLSPRSVTQFVSYNEKESQEKIEYAKRCIDAMDERVKPQLINENMSELRFANGSRIESLPCKEPRGKGKPRIVLDEFAMYGNMDVKIFQAALGACMRGGCVRVGSTPKPSGLFRELATGDLSPAVKQFLGDNLPGFKLNSREWPWWLFGDLTTDLTSAALNAPDMPTQERVERYGTQRLKQIYATYMITGDLAGFQQECECQWVSEAAALIPGPLVDDARKHYAMEEVPRFGVVSIGADFAHRQDQTAFVVMHFHDGHYNVIDLVRMRGNSSREQAAQLKSLIAKYKPTKVLGDITDGFGHAVLMDDVAREFGMVEGMSFSSRTKLDEMAGVVVTAFNHRQIDIPASDTLLADDIKSITKVRLSGGGFKYDSPRTTKGHADSFWALALALYALPRPEAGSFNYESVKKREVDWANMDKRPQSKTVRIGPSRHRPDPNKWSW